MDLHSKITMYVTSTMTSPVTKTTKTYKWLRLKFLFKTTFIKSVRNTSQSLVKSRIRKNVKVIKVKVGIYFAL